MTFKKEFLDASILWKLCLVDTIYFRYPMWRPYMTKYCYILLRRNYGYKYYPNEKKKKIKHSLSPLSSKQN